jgi:copper chaperone
MFNFEVSGMSCEHCAQTISKAIRSVDPGAKVEVDLAAGQIAVQSAGDPSKFVAAIEAAGYGAQRKAD